MARLLALFGPIFAREALAIARRRRYYVLRALYGLLILYVASVAWQESARRPGLGWMSYFARDLFQRLSVAQIYFAVLVVPVLLCGVISTERRTRNLEILFVTDLREREIVLGTLLSRLAVVLLLILSSFAVLSIFALFGGIDYTELCTATLLAMSLATLAGSMAVYFSTRTQRPIRALFGTYVRMFSLAMILLVLLGIVGVLGRGFPSPLRVMWAASLGSLLVALVFMRRAVTRLRNMKRSAGDFDPDAAKPSWVERWNELEFERFFGSRNPIWRDRWLGFSPERITPTRKLWVPLFWVAYVAIACRYSIPILSEVTAIIASGLLVAVWVVVGLLLMGIGAVNPVLDRQNGFWESLLCTPLEGREILRGAILCNWPQVRWMLAIICLVGVVATMWHPLEVIASLVVGALFGATILAMGTLCCLPARETVSTTIYTICFVGLVLAIPYLLFPFADVVGGFGIWLLFALLAVVTANWARRSESRHAIATCFVCMHLMFTGTQLLLPILPRGIQPLSSMSPAFWIFRAVSDLTSVSRSTDDGMTPICVWYVAALLANLWWAWRWANRHFERLADRPGANRCELRTAASPLEPTE